jgi:type IV secretion system protein VirB9
MKATAALLACAALAPLLAATQLQPTTTDPRLRDVQYDPHAVVTVLVKRGVVSSVVLDPDEAIAEVAACWRRPKFDPLTAIVPIQI